MTSETPALAVLDGTLCRLTRTGARAGGHAPLATAVVEFLPGPMCLFVREHPYGLLPGIPNLYCLDGAFRLQWMAEWPDPADPCAALIGIEGDVLVTESLGGRSVRLDARTGALLGVEQPLAVAS